MARTVTKVAPKEVEEARFPPLSCGACMFCNFNPDDKKSETLLCWVKPPEFLYVDDDDSYRFNRGVPVSNPHYPACESFQPRYHG